MHRDPDHPKLKRSGLGDHQYLPKPSSGWPFLTIRNPGSTGPHSCDVDVGGKVGPEEAHLAEYLLLVLLCRWGSLFANSWLQILGVVMMCFWTSVFDPSCMISLALLVFVWAVSFKLRQCIVFFDRRNSAQPHLRCRTTSVGMYSKI